MRTWMLILPLLCGCSNKEVQMAAADTIEKAVQERDEARQIQRLLAEGWESEKRDSSRWAALYLEAQLEAQMMRDKFRREESLHAAADLEIASLRATIATMQLRLEQPLAIPSPQEIGIALAPIDDRYP